MSNKSLWDSFRVHIDYGFSNMPVWNEDGPIPWPGAFYNFLYVLFINLIITAIISGIIIDTFAYIRGQQEAIKEDEDNKCFICNIVREKFEKVGIDFLEHRNLEHPMN